MNCSSVSSAARFSVLQSIWIKRALRSFSIGLVLPILLARPVLGAKRLDFSYGILERSIPIDSLETYAKTGKVDSELSDYVKRANKNQLTQLRQVLLTPIPLNVVQVSQFLYTSIGERLLSSLGKVIQQESGLSGFYAIRASLILAAADPKGFTLLNVLRKFPSDAISIDLGRSLEIANNLKELVNQTQQAVAAINQQSSLEATTTPTLTDVLLGKRLSQPGGIRFSKRTIALSDISRQRQFPADIYLPQAPGSRPVIVISHGLGSDRTSFAYLAEQLASYGFVVAVPEHPGSDARQLQALLSGRADQVTKPREFVDRPLDVKYLLDELNRLSQSDAEFKGHLNMQQVGVVGQSFGGYTALALAGATINFKQLQKNCPKAEDSFNLSLLLQCLAEKLPQKTYNLADPRVKAAIAINPLDSSIMGQASLSQIKIPVMIVSGSADTVAPSLPEQIQPFTWLTTRNKYLALITGGTHFSTIAESPQTAQGAIPVPPQVIGPNPALAQRYVEALSVAFFQTYVAQQPSYLPYLSAGYVSTISKQPLPLSLVQTLNSTKPQKVTFMKNR
ncbi:MAG: alpha/beta hydrolase [Rhizonema sp. NSF051]|nr:alpha/beta hydrolase [Rhizonema sp. NSF051]